MQTLCVIIPAYNASKTISRAIQSAIGADEIIVVDDGSTDGTRELVSRRYKDVVVVAHNENNGLAAARQSGLHSTEADWILFVDADDWLSKTTIGKAKRIINTVDAEIVQMNIRWRVSPLRLPYRYSNSYNSSRALDAALFDINLFPIQCWGKLYRKEFLNAIEFIQSDVQWGEDRLFNLAVFSKSPAIVVDRSMTYNYTYSRGLSSVNYKNIISDVNRVTDIKIEWCRHNNKSHYLQQILDERDALIKYLESKIDKRSGRF